MKKPEISFSLGGSSKDEQFALSEFVGVPVIPGLTGDWT